MNNLVVRHPRNKPLAGFGYMTGEKIVEAVKVAGGAPFLLDS